MKSVSQFELKSGEFLFECTAASQVVGIPDGQNQKHLTNLSVLMKL